jgi:hypothetical protein
MAKRRQQEKPPTQVLEQGDIYFLYRPQVSQGEAEVHGLDDVQRLYLVLSPQGAGRYRLMVMPKKQLPESGRGGPKFWGFVDKVSRRPQEVVDELDQKTYQTRTRGERIQPEARPAAEGVYSIVRHGDHTHLAYVLELPEEPGEVQKAINIEPEASYIISVKNPEQPAPRGVGLDEDRQAAFPKKLQSRFRGRRFAQLDPPDFLNYAGAEVLFIGTGEDVSEDLGIDLSAEVESESTAGIFNDLRLEKSQHPTEPLFRGKWA